MDVPVHETTQHKFMEVESQSKSEWLCNRKLRTSQFEATLDGLVGDGQSIITEFVAWESSGPTGRDSKKPPEQLNWMASNAKDIPINNETTCINRKAHLFWENPVIDAKINDLMNTLSTSGKAAARLVMTGKGCKLIFLGQKERTGKRDTTGTELR